MLEKIRRHSGKIFILIINFLLMATAILAIRAKDQNRLLRQAEDNALKSETDTAANPETYINDPNSFQGQLDQSANVDPALQSGSLPDVTAPPAAPAKIAPPASTQKTASQPPSQASKKSAAKSSSNSSSTSSSQNTASQSAASSTSSNSNTSTSNTTSSNAKTKTS